MASSIRVARSANCSRKSGKCRDCAASTANSINSSPCRDIGSADSVLARCGVGRCDVLAFILRIDKGEASVSICEPQLLPYPTGESQYESIAREHGVAKSPTSTGAPHSLFVSAWDLNLWSPACLRQIVLQSIATIAP